MRRHDFGRWMAGAATAVALAGLAPVAHAALSDPAALQIEAFDAQLIDVMKEAKALGFEGRYRKLEPVVDHEFDIPLMIRVAVGPAWSTLSPGQQQQLTEAFRRLTVASFAHNFGGYSGETFQINPDVVTRGPDKVVQTTLVSPHDQPVAISYRMRQGAGGAWKIIDVFYNGAISQLSTRRSDFQSTLEHGGPSALIAHLNALVDKEMK
ncbi:MAG TPA: ABC transporter substrate-binding protein [Caulobacteraceae bacterium]|nr:ABC transporter substrate-binding protein [Caulobacteraceae bacterium]